MLGKANYYFPLFDLTSIATIYRFRFKYLAIVESALKPHARSRSAATGLWQFMYNTGKIYDLKVTSYVDERSDPIQSTIAACEYFTFYIRCLMIGSWCWQPITVVLDMFPEPCESIMSTIIGL